jgi:hypothetical protein
MEPNQKEIEDLLNLSTEKRKIVEVRLKETQLELTRLQEQLYEIQKQNIKQAISVEGIKKVFGNATPFFMRIKDKTLGKVQEVKEFLDGTSFDKKWVDERYEEYKELCISKGEDIKSKEEFQKIALAIKETDSESDTSILEKLSNVSKEIGYAGSTIKNVWQSMGVEEKIINILKTEDLQEEVEEVANIDKKTVFNDWIISRNVKKSVNKLDNNVLYQDYLQFIEHVHGAEQSVELSYPYKGGAFTAALNRTFKNLEHETVNENGKDVKKVGLKMKR